MLRHNGAAEAARIKAEAKKKAEEDAAAKKKAEDDAKKSAIAVELQKKLVDLVNGKQVDRWALLTVVQQTALVDQVFNQKATFEAYQAAKKSGVEQSNVVVNAMRAADLDADKVWLRRGVAALGAPAVITEMYLAAINLHTYSSSSYGLTIEKSYLEADIIAAAGSWWRIPEMWVDNPNGPPNRVQVKSMLKVVSNVHSPGSNATEIAWKERGDYMERTRNLILRVNGLPSNVHLHPDKNWRKKKK